MGKVFGWLRLYRRDVSSLNAESLHGRRFDGMRRGVHCQMPRVSVLVSPRHHGAQCDRGDGRTMMGRPGRSRTWRYVARKPQETWKTRDRDGDRPSPITKVA